VEGIAKAIRTEATRKNFGLEGHPLPLVCSWQCGHYRADHNVGWRPENQMRLIEEGHYLLPWFSHPPMRVADNVSSTRNGAPSMALSRYHRLTRSRKRRRLRPYQPEQYVELSQTELDQLQPTDDKTIHLEPS
jgi:hypothetical protein